MVREESADPQRSDPLANPLTYFERYQLVKAVLTDQGLQQEAYSIVPLPINLPERYHHYVPMEAVFFLSIYDDWGERKRHYFESLGLRTHIIRRVPSQEKGISATDIRNAMHFDNDWAQWVPPAARRLLTQWDIPHRLKQMNFRKSSL